jgi:CDP-diacylglycerol--glycerol-3-phosphate 3-phosphatidyltransferase
MFSETVRKYSRAFIEPIARLFGRTGISPNVLTVVGFFLMVGVAFVLAQGYFVLGGVLITAFALFDAIDGTLARMTKRTSRFGAFLDSTLDRFSEAIIFFGLFLYFLSDGHSTELILIYATVVGSLMVSYARARAEGIGVPVKDGLFTRFERIFLLVVGLLFDGWIFSNWLTLILWILAIFTNITAVQRMYVVWQITAAEESS